MALVDSVVSVSLDSAETPAGFVLKGMRAGYHFDVVFADEHKAEAGRSIIAWLQTLAVLHAHSAEAEDRKPPQPADVYVQLRVAGVWMERVDTKVSGAITKRLLIQTEGWSFQDVHGVDRAYGCLVDAEVGVV
jgi:hypothetical protein